jgi:hypothetical protein
MKARCPACNKRLTMTAHLLEPDASPSPGDFSICLYCGHLMAFTDDLDLRDLTDQEARDAANDPEMHAFERARARAMK